MNLQKVKWIYKKWNKFTKSEKVLRKVGENLVKYLEEELKVKVKSDKL